MVRSFGSGYREFPTHWESELVAIHSRHWTAVGHGFSGWSSSAYFNCCLNYGNQFFATVLLSNSVRYFSLAFVWDRKPIYSTSITHLNATDSTWYSVSPSHALTFPRPPSNSGPSHNCSSCQPSPKHYLKRSRLPSSPLSETQEDRCHWLCGPQELVWPLQ